MGGSISWRLQVHRFEAALHQPGLLQLPRLRGGRGRQHACRRGGRHASPRPRHVLLARRARRHGAAPGARAHHGRVPRRGGESPTLECGRVGAGMCNAGRCCSRRSWWAWDSRLTRWRCLGCWALARWRWATPTTTRRWSWGCAWPAPRCACSATTTCDTWSSSRAPRSRRASGVK